MRAGLVAGREQIEFREFPDPTPEPEKAVVQISHCGICGTDLHAFDQGGFYSPSICGHEWAGTISAVGTGVDDLREGDRVGIGIAPACGRCRECRSGDAAHCSTALMGMLGIGPLAAPHGGFASAIGIEESKLTETVDALREDRVSAPTSSSGDRDRPRRVAATYFMGTI